MLMDTNAVEVYVAHASVQLRYPQSDRGRNPKMATAFPPLEVQILARPQPESRPQQQNSLSGATYSPSNSSWAVDIYVADEKILDNVLLTDPLKPDQRSLCRWYLEQYVQRFPYSIDLAKEAAHLLNTYPEALSNQLHLQKVLAPWISRATSEDRRQRVVSIEICDEAPTGGGCASTVHQIFWETLENSKLLRSTGWNVIVHRGIHPLLDSGVSLPHRPQPWRQADGATATINILLVIARNTTFNPTTYNDVTPFLASSVLTEIQRKLDERGAAVQIHVEIVRPGTLASFEAHLQRSENIHGPGYFHIVHFDLHGKVGTRAEKLMKYGFLYFCKENSDKTVAVAAYKVGKILKRYSIPYVILNACESGRANCGDDANIAKTFQQQGVRNTLAMSFKTSSGSMELFLSTFYEELLVDRSSFAGAAASARRALHLQPNRPARFGLQRDLSDSFVPVVYGSDQERSVILAGQEMRCRPSTFVDPSIAGSDGITLPLVLQVLGRDFDLLRLEKMLLQSSLVCVHGPAGVGKSAFLRYASSIWKRTAFVDAVINIDLAKEMILSEHDFLSAILGQLLQFGGQQYRTRLWTADSLFLQSHDIDSIKVIIANLLCTLKAVIILEGLEVLFTPFHSSLVPGTLDQIQAFDIWRSIKSLFLPIQAPKRDNSWHLIVTSRHQNQDWLTNLTGNHSAAQYFGLRGLELPDAIEFSQRIICAGGENVEHWNYEDCDWLEGIIDLLQGIPLALLEILPAQRILDVPWRLFYNRLHSGLVTSPAELKRLDPNQCHFLDEMHHLSSALSKHDLLFLSLFSNFWHEAPPMTALQKLFIAPIDLSIEPDFWEKYDVQDLNAQATSLLGFALNRGYIRIDSQGIIPWVHPLFTVYSRMFTFQFERFTDGNLMKNLVVNSIQLLSSLSPKQSSNLEEDLDTENKPPVGNANLLTCINFCLLGKLVISIEQWPMQLFVASIIRLSCVADTATAPWISEKFYQLLKAFSGGFKAPVNNELYGVFFSILLSICAHCPDHIKWPLEHYHEMYQLGSKMIWMLEKHYGQELEPKAALSKGSLLLMQVILSCLHFKDQKEVGIIWQAAKDLKYELFRQLRQGQISDDKGAIQQAEEPYNDSSRNLRNSNHQMDGPIMLRDEAHAVISNSGVEIVYAIFGDLVDMLSSQEAEFLSVKTGKISKEPKKWPMRDAQLQQVLSQYVKSFSRHELEEASQLSSRNLQVLIMGQGDERIQSLKILENANDTGDWIHAFEQHRSMFFAAIYDFLFDEADEHIKALHRIFQKSSNVTPGPEILIQLEQIVQEERSLYMLACSVFPSEASSRQDALAIAIELQQPMAKISPEQFSLAGKHCANMKEKEGSGAYPTHISRELMVKLLRKYGKKRRDPMWVINLNATMESYARLISEVHDGMKAKNFDVCLDKLDMIDELSEKEEFLHDLLSEQPQALLGIRQACECGSALFKVLSEWHGAVSEGDFDAAWCFVEDFAKFQDQPAYDWLCGNSIEQMHMREITEKEHLRHLMLDLQNSHSVKDLGKFNTIYADVVKRWTDGRFPSVNQSQMLSFKSDNLELMIELAVDKKLWHDCIGFCNEYLMASAWQLRGNPRAHDEVLNVRERCEANLIQQSLQAAESNSEFDTCLQLVDDWEKLWQAQNQTGERKRSSFLILSQKLLRFQRDCYRDRCVPCARWARLREQGVCTFDDRIRNQKRKRGNGTGAPLATRHHDRNSLRMPFGCQHHCRGGYCFFD